MGRAARDPPLRKGMGSREGGHLQRRSIPTAERYCNIACLLDPEGKSNHELHRLIIQVKTLGSGYSVWGG